MLLEIVSLVRLLGYHLLRVPQTSVCRDLSASVTDPCDFPSQYLHSLHPSQFLHLVNMDVDTDHDVTMSWITAVVVLDHPDMLCVISQYDQPSMSNTTIMHNARC